MPSDTTSGEHHGEGHFTREQNESSCRPDDPGSPAATWGGIDVPFLLIVIVFCWIACGVALGLREWAAAVMIFASAGMTSRELFVHIRDLVTRDPVKKVGVAGAHSPSAEAQPNTSPIALSKTKDGEER